MDSNDGASLSRESLELPDLKCSVCKNFLSMFPIYASKGNSDFKFLCGRCPLTANLDWQRQIAYEIFVHDVIFPCRYKEEGCDRKLSPDDLRNHELHCLRRPYNCPIESCVWRRTSTSSEIYFHFQVCHRSIMIKDCYVITYPLNRSFVKTNLVRCGNDNEFLLMHLEYNFESKVLSHCVGIAITSKSNNYEIIFSSDTKVYERQELNMITKDDLSISSGRFRNINLEKSTKLIINIDDRSGKTSLSPQEQKQEKTGVLSHLQDEMFKCVECPICMDYMRPPIIICEAGHSICKRCKSNITQCPTCRKPFGNSRNFALEDFTRFVLYPCKNCNNGCPIALPLDEIKNHEKSCTIKSIKCPLSIESGTCTWRKTLSTFIAHVKEHHNNAYMNGQITTITLQKQYNARIAEYDKNIFFVTCQYDGTFFVCSVGLIGPSTNFSDYMYEFQIKPENAVDTIVLRRSCRFLSQFKLAFGTHCIKLHKQCLSKDSIKNISFYVHIMKKRCSNIQTID